MCRLLDSMKVPGQRSSFHICDILDLNNGSDAKGNQNNNNNNNHSTSNNNSNTNTTFPPQTSPPASRDGDSITNLNGKSTIQLSIPNDFGFNSTKNRPKPLMNLQALTVSSTFVFCYFQRFDCIKRIINWCDRFKSSIHCSSTTTTISIDAKSKQCNIF